jgi:hypothetical protein
MQYLIAVILAALLSIALAGCSGPLRTSDRQPPDGIYQVVGDHDPNSIVAVVQNGKRNQVRVRVRAFQTFSPREALAFNGEPPDTNYYVQIKGTAKDENWSKQELLVIAGGISYIELGKTGSVSSASAGSVLQMVAITLTFHSEEDAKRVATALKGLCKN